MCMKKNIHIFLEKGLDLELKVDYSFSVSFSHEMSVSEKLLSSLPPSHSKPLISTKEA